VVNSYGLRLAGVDSRTPDPVAGKVERDVDGEPNGLLRAAAKSLVRSLVPKSTPQQMKEELRL
jgi:predicted amidohydrolase YtcJ